MPFDAVDVIFSYDGSDLIIFPDEPGYQYQQNPYTDLTQLPGEEPLTGRKPRVKADGGIDFTNVLNKSGV